MLSLGDILTIFNFEAHFEPKFDFSGLGHKIFFKVYVLNGLWVFTDSKNLISFRQESSEKMFRFRSTLWATEPNKVVKIIF